MKKLKKLVLLAALGAVVSAVAKKLQADKVGSASSPWQSADPVRSPSTPAPPPEAAAEETSAPSDELVDNAPAPADTTTEGAAADAAQGVEPDLSDIPAPPPSPNHPEANEPPPVQTVDAPPPSPSAQGDPLTDPLPPEEQG